MEKIVERTVPIKFHTIICDECNQEIDTKMEDEDGYYDKVGNRPYISFGDHEFFTNKVICDNCWDNYYKKVAAVFKDLGYDEYEPEDE